MLPEGGVMASSTRPESEEKRRARQIKRNRRAIALLRQWREADDDDHAEMRESWEILKRAFDSTSPSQTAEVVNHE